MTVPNNDLFAGPWRLPVGRWGNIYTKALNAVTSGAIVVPVGLYRVSLMLAITTAGTAGQLRLSVISAGAGGASVTQSLADVLVTTVGNIAQDSFVCDVLSPLSLSYGISATGLTAGSLRYSIRVVAEQLSALT